MNATPTPDVRPDPHTPGPRATTQPPPARPHAVPRPQNAPRGAKPAQGVFADYLEHPDPGTAAQSAAVENLLRCWIREQNLPAPHDDTMRVPLPASGTALLFAVHYWSPTGWHRFGRPVLEGDPEGTPPVDAVTLSALLAREAVHQAARRDADRTDRQAFEHAGSGGAAHDGAAYREVPYGEVADDGGDLVARVADSVRRTALFVDHHRRHADREPDLFLAAEQSLLLGHPFHPTPKGREGLSDREARQYSPELRGSFRLHWMAVDPALLAQDSAWTERGRAIPAPQLTRRLVGEELPLPTGFAALPVHPWQSHDIVHRPEAAALIEAGHLVPLGPHGAPWHPTSSVRTVYQPGAPVMLKLSLGLRITNSRRENLRKELHRGVEVHRLLRSGLDGQWQAAHPGFGIVRDPAWLAVDGTDGEPLTGLDVMIRHNPFGPGDDASCIAGLVSARPVSPRPNGPSGTRGHGGRAVHGNQSRRNDDRPPVPMRSRLAELVLGLAHRTSRPVDAVSTEWFLRYLEQVVRPVLWLDSEAGVALEAHQQNTLVLLDPEGWPVGGRYRDNQGYYFRASRHAELDRRLPGIGTQSDTFVSDEVTDERFAYYLGINNAFGLIGAFGSQRLADEAVLLAAFRRFLESLASGPARLRTPLPERLLDSPQLRCKANLLTRLHGLDELVGPVDTQSVYVTVPNPLHS